MQPIVTVADTSARLSTAFDSIFAPYGGIGEVIPLGSKVHLKPNAIHFSRGMHTDPAVVDALGSRDAGTGGFGRLR